MGTFPNPDRCHQIYSRGELKTFTASASHEKTSPLFSYKWSLFRISSPDLQGKIHFYSSGSEWSSRTTSRSNASLGDATSNSERTWWDETGEKTLFLLHRGTSRYGNTSLHGKIHLNFASTTQKRSWKSLPFCGETKICKLGPTCMQWRILKEM